VTKQSGMGDRFFVNGVDVSGDIGALGNIGGGPAAGEVTDITQSAVARIGLLRDGRIEFTSWFNPAPGRAFKTFSPLPSGDLHCMYLRGTAIGGPAAGLIARQINYDPNREASGMLTFGASMQGDGFGLEWGEQLTPGIRTDTTATNGTGYDFGATSSLFGGQAYLQVFALTGTSVTVKIQDSADNVTFADVTGLTFTAATVAGAQRLQTLNNATVRRYVRAVTTGTFSNAQFAVMFVRNQTLGVLF
jgi:hypothetical protein